MATDRGPAEPEWYGTLMEAARDMMDCLNRIGIKPRPEAVASDEVVGLLARNARLFAALKRLVGDGPRLDELGYCAHCGAHTDLHDPMFHEIGCRWADGAMLLAPDEENAMPRTVPVNLRRRARMALEDAGLPEYEPNEREGFSIRGHRSAARVWLQISWAIPGGKSGDGMEERRVTMAKSIADVLEGIGLCVNRAPFEVSEERHSSTILAGETPEDVATGRW